MQESYAPFGYNKEGLAKTARLVEPVKSKEEIIEEFKYNKSDF